MDNENFHTIQYWSTCGMRPDGFCLIDGHYYFHWPIGHTHIGIFRPLVDYMPWYTAKKIDPYSWSKGWMSTIFMYGKKSDIVQRLRYILEYWDHVKGEDKKISKKEILYLIQTL